jgi:predicted NAD-dependent protein-ADP-ribosyltransferase YbiA (DUF1768 family)
MASPSIIENDKGTPKYLSPDIERNKSMPSSMKRIPVNIGASIETNLPLNADYLQGYATERLQLDARTPEQYQYQAQSSWDAFKNGLTQFGAEAILGTVKSAATLLDLPQYVNIAMNKEREYNTLFGEYIDEISEGIRERNPVFGTEEVELANPKFWASLLPDLGTTVSLFLPTGAAVKGLSLVTKGIMGANKAGGMAGKVANHILNNKDTYKGVGAAMISRTMESSLEAEGTLKESYEKYLSEGYGDEQAKQMAGEDARNTYVANLPLVLLDAVQYTSLYKGMFNPLRGARAAERALANTTSNAILKAARGVYRAGKAVSGVAMESGEELLQFGIQKEASESDSGINTLLDAISNLPNYVSDPEAQKAMISGAFGGGVFEGLSYAQRKLFKKDAEIDNDLEAGRVAGAHYKSMKTFMDIMNEDRIKLEKLTNEGRANQHIPKADSFLEAAKFDTDSFTPEDIKTLEELKNKYADRTFDYINKGFKGEQLNKIVEEDMKATIFTNLKDKLAVTKPNSPQVTDKELRLKALSLLEEMESNNIDFSKTSKIKAGRILREVRREKRELLKEMQQEPDFNPEKLNRKIKPDSKYREALTVQSNIETATVLANIANNNLNRYTNKDILKDDIAIDKMLESYEDLLDYKDKFNTPDEYINYLDKLSKDAKDEDLDFVINSIYDDLIEESLREGKEVNPILEQKITDKNLFEFNKQKITADVNAPYDSLISTPIISTQSSISLTNNKEIKPGLFLQTKDTKKDIGVVLGIDTKGVRILDVKTGKIFTDTKDSVNNTLKTGTFRTTTIDGVNYIVATKMLIDINTGEIIIPKTLEDKILFRKATLDVFSTSVIAKIEDSRKKALIDSDMMVMDAEKLYAIDKQDQPIDKDFGLLARIFNRTFKKTLGINPKLLIENSVYSLKYYEKGKAVDRIFIYRDKEFSKQIKVNNVLQDDPNYDLYDDTISYVSFKRMLFPTKSEIDVRNINKINNEHDAKYIEALQNDEINAQSAIDTLILFNSRPNGAVLLDLINKNELDNASIYDFEELLNNNLKDNKSNDKTASQFISDTRNHVPNLVLPTNITALLKDYDVFTIDDGKNIPITLDNGNTMHLTNESGVLFLIKKDTKKLELGIIETASMDADLINLSVAQAFVENTLGIPVYTAKRIKADGSEVNDVTLISLYTYDDVNDFPYKSGYEFINQLTDSDSMTLENETEKALKRYSLLEKDINKFIKEGKTTVKDLVSIISGALSRIKYPPKFSKEISDNEKIKSYIKEFNDIITNINQPNVQDLIVRDEKDLNSDKSINITRGSDEVIEEEYAPLVIPTSIEEVKAALSKLNTKEFTISDDSKQYIDREGNRYDRVSSIDKTGEFKGDGKAANRGTIIDEMLRAFIIDSNVDIDSIYANHRLKNETEEFTPEFINDLKDIFKQVKDITEEKGLTLISDIPTLWGTIRNKKYAGTIDLLGIDRNNNIYIIDLKTSTQDRTDATGKFYAGYKKSDSNQQSGYAELLRQRTGLTVKKITLFPIQTTLNKSTKKYTKAQVNARVVNNQLDISINEYNDFIDKGIVTENRLNIIANKVKNNEVLSPEETAMYSAKTSEINNILVELKNKIDDIERRRQEELKGQYGAGFRLQKRTDTINEELTERNIGSIEKAIQQGIEKGKTANEILGILNGLSFIPANVGNGTEALRNYLQSRIDGSNITYQQVHSNGILTEINAKYDAELDALEQSKPSQEVRYTMSAEINREIFPEEAKQSEERITGDRVDNNDIDVNDYIVTNGDVHVHNGVTFLYTENRTPGIINPDNTVTDIKGNKIKKNVKKFFLRNKYNKVKAALYNAISKIKPLVLNNKYVKQIIYMDNAAYSMLSILSPEVTKSFNDAGVYLYGDMILKYYNENNPNNQVTVLNEDIIKSINLADVDTYVQNAINTGSVQSVIKRLRYNNLSDYTNDKGAKSLFRVDTKVLFDYLLDANGIADIKDPKVKEIRDAVNNFSKTIKEGELINDYNDIVNKLFGEVTGANVEEALKNLVKRFNNIKSTYTNKYKTYTLNPIPEKEKEPEQPQEPQEIPEEGDFFIQSDLFEGIPLQEGQAYQSANPSKNELNSANEWRNDFNRIMGTSYSVDELKTEHEEINESDQVQYLYVGEGVVEGITVYKVISFVEKGNKKVPLGLVDTLPNVLKKKQGKYDPKETKEFFINIVKLITEGKLLPNQVITGVKGVIGKIMYTNKHEQRTRLNQFTKIDYNIVKVKNGSLAKHYNDGQTRIPSSSIINYNKILDESKKKPNSSFYYMVFPVSSTKYVLHMINSEEFMMSDNDIERLFSIKDYNQLLTYANRFNLFSDVEKFIIANKDIVGTEDIIKKALTFFSKNDKNLPSNVRKVRNIINFEPSDFQDIYVNIGVNGFMNTNFIVSNKYITEGDTKVTVEPITRKKDDVTESGKRKRSIAKGLVSAKLSRENALNNLKRILPEGYDVRFYENLIKEGNDYLWGYVSQNVIGLSDQGRIGEEYHEAFHVVFNAFINQTERERLLGHIKNYYKSNSNNSYTEEQLNDVDFAEELLADLYRDFALAYDEQGNKSLLDWIKGIPSAIIRFFKRLFNLETSIQRDKQKLDKFFKSISSGTFTKNSAELIKSFKASKATSLSTFNGTEKAEIIKMFSSIALDDDIYDLTKPSTLLNNFSDPEKSVLTSITNESTLTALIKKINKNGSITPDNFSKLQNIVKGLRRDVDVIDNNGVIELVKSKDILEPEFGDLHSFLVKSFAKYGYIINDASLNDIVYDYNNENEDINNIENEAELEKGEEEVEQKEGFLIKKFLEAPHLKLRGKAKILLSLINTGATDIFGFGINLKFTPTEATHKFLSAFGGSVDVDHLKFRMQRMSESNDTFYKHLYEDCEEVFTDKTNVYSELWNTLGKLSKADFFNTYVRQASMFDEGSGTFITRINANIDDLQSKLYKKFRDIETVIKKIYSDLPKTDNELLLQKFAENYTSQEDVKGTLENRIGLTALMNFIGYNDIDETVKSINDTTPLNYYQNISKVPTEDLRALADLFKSFYVRYDEIYKSNNFDKLAEISKDLNKRDNKILLSVLARKLPNDIASTHRTLDDKLYYDWQTPNAVSRLINLINSTKDVTKRGKETIPFKTMEKIYEKYNVDRLYRHLPIMSNTNLKYEESNGFITDGGITTTKNEVQNYSSKDLMLEILNNIQENSFVSPILSDSGRQVYIGGIDMVDYDKASLGLLRLVLIENNRRLTKGGDTFKSYKNNKSKLYIFPELESILPDTIVNFEGLTNTEINDLLQGEQYSNILTTIKSLVNQNALELKNTLIEEEVLNPDNTWQIDLIREPKLKELNNLDLQLQTLVANHIFNHTQLVYLLVGDPAYYKSLEDLVKRAKQIVSPSSVINIDATFKKKTSNDYDVSDIITVDKDMKVFIEKDIEEDSINQPDLAKLNKEIGKSYKNVNKTDGQSRIDDIAYRNRLIAENIWTDELQEYMDDSMKGYPASRLTLEKAGLQMKEGETKAQYIFRIRKQSDSRVIKPFYFSMINQSEDVVNEETGEISRRDFIVPFQKKDSELRISPYYGLKTINGVENIMYNPQYYDDLTKVFGYTIEQEVLEKVVENGVTKTRVKIPHKVTYDARNRKADIISYESTLKTFVKIPKEGNAIVTVPFEHWGRQMETPKGHFNKDNTLGTQIRKLITKRVNQSANIIRRFKNNVVESVLVVQEEFNQLLIDDIKRAEQRFLKMVQKDGKRDAKKVLRLLRTEINSRSNPSQYLEALEVIGESDSNSEILTKLPASHPFHTEKIQNILFSIHRKKVNRMKFKSGYKLANASSVGFKRQPQIVFNNSANPKEGIKHFEVYAPIHDTRLYEFVDEGSGLIPESRMSEIEAKYPGILDGVVYRIPTEDKYSMYKIKIIGFIADETGAIFMPDVATTRSGLDFDIDKMFGFFINTPLSRDQYAFNKLEAMANQHNQLINDYINNELSYSFKLLKRKVESGLASETDIIGYNNVVAKMEELDTKLFEAINKELNDTDFNDEYQDYVAQIESDNKKLHIMMDILSSEHTVVEQMTPGGFEDMELHALELQYIERLSEGYMLDGVMTKYTKEQFFAKLEEFRNLDKKDKQEAVITKKKFWDIGNMSKTIKRMNVGKKVLGAAANYNAMAAVVENYKITQGKALKLEILEDGKKHYEIVKYNNKRLKTNITDLSDLDDIQKNIGTGMVVAASADNGKTSTLEPLGIDFDNFTTYVGLYGYGFPRRTIEKILKVYNSYSKKYDTLDILHTMESNNNYNITNDRLDFALFNQSIEDIDVNGNVTINEDILSLLQAVNIVIHGSILPEGKRGKGAAKQGLRVVRLFKRLKYGDNGLGTNLFESADIVNDIISYKQKLAEERDTELSYIMNDSKLFANVSRNKMVTGLKQMLTIMGIPFNMIKIYSKYRIPEEYTKKFYYAIYSYLHKNYMDEFNNPNRYDNMQGEYKKKVTRITNAVNHLRDFKKAYPDNIFLKQLSVDTVSNKMFFTEERKKDDALIESTMDDFQRLLDSNEYITVTDKYTGKEVKMNTSDFANDLVYYTIQAYGFTYNYQSFSYLIPPDYYNDNIKNYTASITDLFNKTIENEGIMNSIHVEFLLNNPDMIKEDTIGIERTYQNYTLLIEDYIEFLKLQSLNDREYLEKIPSIVGNSFLEQMFSLGVDRPLGSLTYQNPFNEGSNKNKLNPQSVLTLMKDFTVEPMKFYTSFKYKGEVFVKIEENDFSVKYMIAKSSNVVNSKSLQSRLTEKIQGLRNIKAINVTDATANQYIDYGLYSQPFMMSYLPDISGDLNIPRIKSREQRLSTIDAVYRPVETVDKVKIIDILTQQRKPGTSTFIKTLYDLANKYNVSVLDIIKNTGDVGNTTLYNELVQKSNSKNLEVDFHYFDDVLTISESSVQDKEGEENGNELPQTMFDVIRKLNETIGSNLDNLLLNLKDEYAGKLIYATPGAGKTFIASMSKNVIDFDNLLAQHITNIDSTAVRQPGQTIQDFIYNNLGTSGFQNNAFNEALKLMENGYTVLTGSKELIKRSDYVFTMPSTKRFSEARKLEELQKEIELANRFNIPITEISNLQDVLVEKPRVEETKISVEITNSKYTRADVMNNPDTAYVFTENTYSMSEFPDRVGGGTAVIRGLKNAYGIVTRKKYDYDTKEKVDYADTPEDFQEFTEINETLIDYIKESGKSKIVFPPGFANDKAKLPTRFAEWLQTALLDNFGLVTELNSTKTGLISKSVVSQQDEIQSKIDFQVETSGNTIGEMYRNRTIKNASADATIAIAVNFETPGEKLTKSSVVNQGKKYIPIDAKVLEVTESRVNKVVDMLNSVNAKTLNIAGNGIYTMKGLYTQEQLDEFSYQLIKAITESPNLKNKIVSIRSGGQTGFDEAGAKAGIRLGIPTTVLAPKGWSFRNIDSMDISNEKMFKERFKTVQQPETQTEINIYDGTGENAELSNFAIRPFKAKEPEQEGDTVSFNSVEQAFQYFKTFFANEKSPEERLEVYKIADDILKTTNGGELRTLGKSIPSFDSKVWDENSSGYMKALMLESFIQNPDALQKLLATGNTTLTHKYKGAEQDKGRFSKLLMEVRDELRGTTDTNEFDKGSGFNKECNTRK